MSLTFKFPSWQVRISDEGVRQEKDVWESAPQVWDDDLNSLCSDDDEAGPSARGIDNTESAGPIARRRLGNSSASGSARCAVAQLPAEVVLWLAEELSMEDIFRCMRTCREWHDVLMNEALWASVAAREDVAARCKLALCKEGVHRAHWLKSSILGTAVGQRFMVLRKGYHFLREALHARWDDVAAAAAHPSARVRVTHVDQLWDNHQQLEQSASEQQFPTRTIMNIADKLTTSNWSLLYEGLVEGFTDRADRIAYELQPQLLKVQAEMANNLPTQQRDHSRIDITEGMDPEDKARQLIASSKQEGKQVAALFRPVEGIVLWNFVLDSWDQYRTWLRLAGSFCPKLAMEVERERGVNFASTGKPGTPRVIDYGAICFRSQVLLAFGLRACLQHTADWLAASVAVADEVGWAAMGESTLSEGELSTFIRVKKLLQEADVSDDAAQPTWKKNTQAKMRSCYAAVMGGSHSSVRRWATYYSSSGTGGAGSSGKRCC